MNNQENSVPDAEIENMTFSYSSLPVIDHMNFILNSGDYVILTGENGCGKSTFLKLLLGELIPRQGKIYLFGQTVSPAVFRRFYIGYVPQNSISKNHNFPATVREIMWTGLYGKPYHKRKRRQSEEKICSALSELEMQDYLGRQIGELSGGQQQRIMLARALISMPQLLILDESTAGMDAHSLELFCQVLEKQNHENKLTILLVTHGNTEKFHGANRYVTIENGRMIE